MDESNIHWVIWIELVMMMIWKMSGNWIAWLILHLIVNSSASIEVMLIAWWRVFLIGFECEWMCTMEAMTLFLILILVSNTTMIVLGLDGSMKTILSSSQIWADLVSLLLWSAQ